MNTMVETAGSKKHHGWLVIGLPTGAFLYTVLLLLPNWVPQFGSSLVFLYYVLSVGILIMALAAIALGTGVSVLWVRLRRGSFPGVLRVFVAASLSLLAIAGVAVLAKLVPRGLPSGSNLARFESSAWINAAEIWSVADDITIRQKMLGDVVASVLPGSSRSDIEAALGPSLDTPYFQESHRDLIYCLGKQRDSFFPIDSEWLLIWLNPEGRVARYEIRTD